MIVDLVVDEQGKGEVIGSVELNKRGGSGIILP